MTTPREAARHNAPLYAAIVRLDDRAAWLESERDNCAWRAIKNRGGGHTRYAEWLEDRARIFDADARDTRYARSDIRAQLVHA